MFVGEVVDLWFYCFVMLLYFDLSLVDVIVEFECCEGLLGIEEKVLCKCCECEENGG